MSVITTLVVAMPLYGIVSRVATVRLRAAAIGGVCVGLLLTGAFWMLEGRLWSALFTPVHGILGGLITAVVWWHLAGAPALIRPLDRPEAFGCPGEARGSIAAASS